MTRSYHLSLVITGSIALSKADVDYITKSSNKTLKDKSKGYQLVAAATGGEPVDASNFDKVFEMELRSGFRSAFRNNEMADFEGMTGTEVSVNCTPVGTSLSDPKEQAE